MRLTCPNCGAQYEVPDEVIPAEGRDVQCSNCGNTWFQAHSEHAHETDQAALAPDRDDDAEPDEWEPPERDAAWMQTDGSQSEADESAAAGHDPDTRFDGHDEDDEPDPQPVVRRQVEPDVSDILRQEADREARLRAAEAGGLESQPELGLDSHGDDEPARRAREARDRMARMRGEQPTPATPHADPGSRRGLLPDIEEINSTLRSTGETGGGTEVGPAREQTAPAPRRKGGFMRGFLLVVIVALALWLIYSNAPQIARSVPQADPMLSAYVALVDQARVWLDAQASGLLPK
ncbi:MAG: zinc-ribbon domain-containing protein [Jhaorihella sp.]